MSTKLTKPQERTIRLILGAGGLPSSRAHCGRLSTRPGTVSVGAVNSLLKRDLIEACVVQVPCRWEQCTYDFETKGQEDWDRHSHEAYTRQQLLFVTAAGCQAFNDVEARATLREG